MNSIDLKIRQILVDKVGADETAITNQATIYNDLGIDSLDFCEVIVDIEKAFDISIPDEAYDKFKTVGGLVTYVKLHAKQHLQEVA